MARSERIRMRIYSGLMVVCFGLVVWGCGGAGALKKTDMKKNVPPRVQIIHHENGHYEMMVEGKPFIVKGVCYAPIPIGKSHLFNFPSDPNKPWIVDGKLMQEMGINTIRLYTPGDEWQDCLNMIEELYSLYGIRTIMGHGLGFWDYPPPNYAEQECIDEVTEDVLKMVEFFRNSPAILFWNLGNENNYSFDGRLNPWSTDEIDAMENFSDRTDARAGIYYRFVNDLAKKIKTIDRDHPVSLGNGELVGLKIAAQECPEVDLLGCIVYRGKVFGNFFKAAKQKFDRPIVLTEFGCDAFNAVTQEEDQQDQAIYLKSQWLDMEYHMAGAPGQGNCLGGVIFEWTDEWWKSSDSDRDSWLVHDTVASWGVGAFAFDAKAGKNMNEEWFGIVAIEPELEAGINKRVPRKAYYSLQWLWTNERTRDPSELQQRKSVRGQKI